MDDLCDRLASELEAVGGVVHRADDAGAARHRIRKLLRERQVGRVVRGRLPALDDAALDAELKDDGVVVTVCELAGDTRREELREASFRAGAGLTSAEVGIASTGTLALLTAPGSGRALSLLPPVHIAVLDAGDLVPDLASCFRRVTAGGTALPSVLTLITGPSRTGDIELVLTLGVHGPRELHLILVG